MPTDKIIILAEGQGPIFADRLRFFRIAPFKAMERFSQANLPDVPAMEFLPQRPVPATTPGYVGDHTEASRPEELEPEQEKVAKLPSRKPAVTPKAPAGGHEKQTPKPAVRRAAARIRSSSTTLSSLDADFAKAARRLRALAKAPPGPGSQRDKTVTWARIFDETVPDEMEIAEAEAL